MRQTQGVIPAMALGLLGTAGLFGQGKTMNWQNSCFNNPAAPYCQGHDFAVSKKPAANDAGSKPSVKTTRPYSDPRSAGSSTIVVGALDWRFADPLPDAVIGFNVSNLAASPLARGLIGRLGATASETDRALTDADMKKIFDGLSGVDQVAMSVRNNRVVVMVTGRAAESTVPPAEAGFKATSVSGNAMLFGHSDAVDQAAQRMAVHGLPADAAHQAFDERQSTSEFWVTGSPALLGPQAMSLGVKRFSLAVSIQDRLVSDLAFEFNGVPNANTLKTLQTTLGPSAVLEGNVMHVRTSIEAAEMDQKFAEIAASPLGQRLSELVKAAQYLPAPDTTVKKRTRPVIYGLDDGPREVN